MKQSPQTKSSRIGHRLRWLPGLITKCILPLAILVAAVGFMKHQMETRPMTQRTKPPKQARLVTVQTVEQKTVQASVEAMGTVIAAQQISLSPEVSGRIIQLDPSVIPGGIVTEGQELVRIDARDYEFIQEQRRSDVARAQLNLKLEQGHQAVAQQEYKLLGEDIAAEDRELILRQPQLVEAKSALKAAEAALDKAELDVARCTIHAPFNAVIQNKMVDLGKRVAPGTELMSLVGTDEYWVEVSVPVSQLPWIDVPILAEQAGAKVKVYDQAAWGQGVYRQGRLIRRLGQVEPEGRMARLLVAVEDPLALTTAHKDKQAMLLGSYVRVEISGKIMNSVIPLNRAWLRNGDQVWVMDSNDTLRIQPVRIGFRGREQVCVVDGLPTGARVVKTDIAAPVEGMPLRLNDNPVDEEGTDE